MPKCTPSWTPFFDNFLVDFCSQLRPSKSEKSSPRCSQSTIFEKSPLEVNIDFWTHFGANLAPFWDQKSTKIGPKIDPKRHRFFDRFLHRFFLDFGSLLGPKLGPCWPHFPQKRATLWYAAILFVGSMSFFDFLVVLAPSWLDLGSILEGLGLHFGGFWTPFWRFLVTICVPCGL